jgi:hypothetical protein
MALMTLLKSRVAVVAIIAAIAVLFAARPTDSCGFYDPVVLGFDRRPDGPLSSYAAGRVGLFLGTFARSHLVVAWRHLSGVPLSEGEQQGYVALAENRIAYKRTLIDAEAAAKKWVDARNAAAAGMAIKPPTVWVETSNYESVLGLTIDENVRGAPFLHDAPRAGVGYDSQREGEPWETEAKSPKQTLYFDADAVTAINQSLPLDVLVAAARDREVDERLHGALLVAAWTRAWLLDRDDVAADLSPALQTLFPELRKPLEAYLKTEPSDRHYKGLHLLVHFPGLLPHVRAFQERDFTTPLADVPHDSYTHNNWWCTDGIPFRSIAYPESSSVPFVVVPAFANEPGVRAQAIAEQKTLRERGSGSTFLLHALMAWSEARPADPRIADDLALTIRTTQWACPDSKTRATAHAAYDFLHSHYPKSEAAKRTRYWYDGRS